MGDRSSSVCCGIPFHGLVWSGLALARVIYRSVYRCSNANGILLDFLCGEINSICELFKQNNPMMMIIMDNAERRLGQWRVLLLLVVGGRISGRMTDQLNAPLPRGEGG